MIIQTLGAKVLTQRARRIAKVDDTVRSLCAAMIDTMLSNNGIGLAANQVGILKTIIVILHQNEPKVLINPEIVEASETTCDFDEGCLSIPDTLLTINRPEKIKVKYRDTKGKPHFEEYDGLSARVIQHEIDHLMGITMNIRKNK